MVDVVDSTALTARLGHDAAATLWTAHDRCARDLLRAWHGREIDKTDGFLLIFRDARDALGFAIAYHQAIDQLEPPLRARAGLHVDEIELRETPAGDVALGAKPLELDGLAKSVAARVMSVAMGGQTLLTLEARAALGSPAVRVQSHGHWRLKGLEQPVELFEAGDERAPFAPPPDAEKAYRVVRKGELWLPQREVRHGLPAERDAFIGRHAALRELQQRFEAGARLVSLTGFGGTGKTRLALRFGWRSLGDLPGGAWFCDLSSARSVEGLLRAVAQGLDVTLAKEEPVIQLGHALAGRGACLVIFDNFEQLASHAEGTLGRWLERAPLARFLVTTRELLGIAGEQTVNLPPLEVEEAKALFLVRAAAAGHAAESVQADRVAIESLVQMLDGLPLAIELAAARARILPPRALLARMSERFQVLSAPGGRRDRQSTLRAAFDWSWDLLSLADKSTLAQLAVFEGGFTLDAAEATVDVSGVDAAPWTLDTVQSLVDKSFVRALAGERFGLLTSVQDYAAEHLRTPGRFAGSGEAAQASAFARHGAFFASFGPRRAITHRCADADNLVAACRRAVARGDVDVAVGALEGAWGALALRGPFKAAVQLASAVCGMQALSDAASARAAVVLGRALSAAGEHEAAEARFQQALEQATSANDAVTLSHALRGLADRHAERGAIEQATRMLEQALEHARRAGDASAEFEALNSSGTLAWKQGQSAAASAHYAAALEVAHRADDRFAQCLVRANLGLLHDDVGHVDDARLHFDAALVIARELGDRLREGNILCNLGLRQLLRGEPAQAQARLESALLIGRELGYVYLEYVTLCNVALVYEELGRPQQALEALDASLVLARHSGDHRTEGQVLGYRGRLLATRERARDAAADLEEGLRLLREARDPFSTGILLCCRAEAEALAGRIASAQADLAQAAALAHECEAAPSSELGWALARARKVLERSTPA